MIDRMQEQREYVKIQEAKDEGFRRGTEYQSIINDAHATLDFVNASSVIFHKDRILDCIEKARQKYHRAETILANFSNIGPEERQLKGLKGRIERAEKELTAKVG